MDNAERMARGYQYPRVLPEVGEIERVAVTFGYATKDFAPAFLKATLRKPLETLSDEIWKNVENTDSLSITKGDWGAVALIAESHGRDWRMLKEKMEKGQPIDAPIIVKLGGKFHLVSGNTRLMVARALGVRPRVLVVDMNSLAKK